MSQLKKIITLLQEQHKELEILKTALHAIIDRVQGVYDSPALEGYMLSTDEGADCKDIAEDALLAVGEPF